MAERGGKGPPSHLSLIPEGVCGHPTRDGAPCSREADGRCWQHEGTDPPTYTPFPPSDHLGTTARHCWNRIAPSLERLGILSEFNRPMLETYCELYEAKRQAYDEWRDGDASVEDGRGGAKKNPAWTVYQQAANNFRLAAAEMGLTATSVKKLLGSGDDTGRDPLAKRLG